MEFKNIAKYSKCEMDIKMEIKEEFTFLNINSEIRRERVSQENTIEMNDNSSEWNNEMEIKINIKEETVIPQCNILQCMKETKEALVSDFFQRNKAELFDSYPTTNIESRHRDYKIETQETWQEISATEIPSFDEIQDGMDESSTSTEPIRLYTGMEPPSKSILLCELLRKDRRFSIKESNPLCRRARTYKSKESNLPKTSPAEKGFHSDYSSCLKRGNFLKHRCCNACYYKHPEFKCDNCKKKFTSAARLNTHSLLRVCKLHFRCDACDLRFSDFRFLRRHKFIHEDIRSHKCTVCQKSFSLLVDLRRHEELHFSSTASTRL